MNRRHCIHSLASAALAGGFLSSCGQEPAAGRSYPRDASAAKADREFDWAGFLQRWNAHVKSRMAEILVTYGIGGPPDLGIRKMIEFVAKHEGVQLSSEIEDLLAPIVVAGLPGEVAAGDAEHAGQLLHEGKRRIGRTQQ